MMKSILATFISVVFIQLQVYGQLDEYIYQYRFKVNGQSSYIHYNSSNQLPPIRDELSHNVTFNLTTVDGDIPFGVSLMIIIDNRSDTIMVSPDNNGIANVEINGYGIRVISRGMYSNINEYIHLFNEEKNLTVNIVLGSGYILWNPIIYSKRKLTSIEINTIIFDTIYDTKKSELLKTKTCIVMYEI